MPTIVNSDTPDVVLIGAGIMSATLGTFLKELEPSLTVTMFETLHDCALESSKGWNNAGTGHAANCELNYTHDRARPLLGHIVSDAAQAALGAGASWADRRSHRSHAIESVALILMPPRDRED